MEIWRRKPKLQIADLSEILKQHNAVKPGYSQLKKTLLRDVTSIDIRSLGGFKKGFHRVPDHVSSATQDFVVSKSKDEIETEMNDVFASIKEHLKYKRRELISEAGRIVTPDFEYLVYATQNEDNPSEADNHSRTHKRQTQYRRQSCSSNEVFDGRFSGCTSSSTWTLT